MKNSISQIQESLAKALNSMPDVFSTVQWGGRAYKLPGPGSRGTKRPVLLAHVWIEKDETAIGISFKLDAARARAMTRKHAWIAPHSFRTLAPSGWITAEVRTRTQCKALIELLREARAMHPVSDSAAPSRTTARRGKPGSKAARADGEAFANRIGALLRRKREEGWKPAGDDDLDA